MILSSPPISNGGHTLNVLLKFVKSEKLNSLTRRIPCHHLCSRFRLPCHFRRLLLLLLPNRRFSLSNGIYVSLNLVHFSPKTSPHVLIYMAADLTSQMITMSFDDSIDKTRTLRMGAYGLLILGPSQHLWFNFMSTVLPKRDMLSTIKKIFLGQAVYGPSITSVFFSYNASLQGENGREIRGRLGRDLLPTLLNGLLYWPVCDFLTYKFVPVHLQPLMNSSCSYVWTIYLTYKASLEKVSSSEE